MVYCTINNESKGEYSFRRFSHKKDENTRSYLKYVLILLLLVIVSFLKEKTETFRKRVHRNEVDDILDGMEFSLRFRTDSITQKTDQDV